MESLGDMAGFSSEEFSGSGTVAIVNAIELVHSLLIIFFFWLQIVEVDGVAETMDAANLVLLTGSGWGASLFMGRVKNFLYWAFRVFSPICHGKRQ